PLRPPTSAHYFSFFYLSLTPRSLHSFPTRRSSDLIGAMAFGTASVPRVDRIVGPGNAYVAEAKLAVSREVAIDSPAGPSEVLVVDRKSTRLNSSHVSISYAVFCLKKKKNTNTK